MASDCPFCRIASGDVPAAIVFQDDVCVAFLDDRPLFPGHCLLIPRAHYETLPELPPDSIDPLFAIARRLCAAVEEGMEAEGSFLAINNRVSQSVPHLHIHVAPRRRKDGLRGFFWPRTRYADSTDMERVRAALENAFQRATPTPP